MSRKLSFIIGAIVLIVAAVIILASIGFYSRQAMEELPSMAETMPPPAMEPPAMEPPAEEEMAAAPPLPAEAPADRIPQPNGHVTGESATMVPRAPASTPFSATISELPGAMTGGVEEGSEMAMRGAPVARNGGGPPDDMAMEKAAAVEPLDRYKVELGVDAQLQRPGPPGELKVWIGAPGLGAEFGPGMATAETEVPAIGQTARVTPVAPDFEVSPAKSICMKIHPSGSEARFTIKPRATGTFKVSADVLLYESDVCEGAPVPKSPDRLTVRVVVNKKGVAIAYLLQLWDIFWQGVLDFWQWLVAAIFGLFIFLIRKRLKKLFGYDAPGP